MTMAAQLNRDDALATRLRRLVMIGSRVVAKQVELARQIERESHAIVALVAEDALNEVAGNANRSHRSPDG